LTRAGTVDLGLISREGQGLRGEGVLATIRFELRGTGDAGIATGPIVARDGMNANLDLAAEIRTGSSAQHSVPAASFLNSCFPNPFNPSTTLEYGLALAGHVSISVFDLRGRQVRQLVDEVKLPGLYSVEWDGTDARGSRLASGVYLARMSTRDNTLVRRMVLAK